MPSVSTPAVALSLELPSDEREDIVGIEQKIGTSELRMVVAKKFCSAKSSVVRYVSIFGGS